MKGSLVCLDTQRTNRCTKVSTFVRTGKGKHSTDIDRQGRCVVVRQAGRQAAPARGPPTSSGRRR